MVEAYNGLSKYFFFDGEGVIADNDPMEREKAVKYNDLVANAVICHNVRVPEQTGHRAGRRWSLVLEWLDIESGVSHPGG